MDVKVRRPVLRYYGGKWRIAPWIIENLPVHRTYVEPYGGGGSVLLRKGRVYAEVLNDLDGEVVNLFRVLRDPSQARELVRLLKLTPYARTEFEMSYVMAGDPIEQARRTVARSFMGFGGLRAGGTGFRGNCWRSGSTPAHDWGNYPDVLWMAVERLRGVVIENRLALDVVAAYDREDTLFYVDPPYPIESRRGGRKRYRYEMTDADHRELAAVLRVVEGMVVISGYPCRLYDEDLYGGWRRVERRAFVCSGNRATEVLWMNEAAVERGLPMFQFAEAV